MVSVQRNSAAFVSIATCHAHLSAFKHVQHLCNVEFVVGTGNNNLHCISAGMASVIAVMQKMDIKS